MASPKFSVRRKGKPTDLVAAVKEGRVLGAGAPVPRVRIDIAAISVEGDAEALAPAIELFKKLLGGG
jgi:hypothetical protein